MVVTIIELHIASLVLDSLINYCVIVIAKIGNVKLIYYVDPSMSSMTKTQSRIFDAYYFTENCNHFFIVVPIESRKGSLNKFVSRKSVTGHVS